MYTQYRHVYEKSNCSASGRLRCRFSVLVLTHVLHRAAAAPRARRYLSLRHTHARSIERTSPSLASFAVFHHLLLETHCLPPSADVTIGYHDPRSHNIEATSISSDESLERALAGATPLLRLFLHLRSDIEVSHCDHTHSGFVSGLHCLYGISSKLFNFLVVHFLVNGYMHDCTYSVSIFHTQTACFSPVWNFI